MDLHEYSEQLGSKLDELFPSGIQVSYEPPSNTIWYANASMPDNVIYGFSSGSGAWTNGKPAHGWLTKDGLASHMRIMRGEEKLPHMPTDCQHCRDMYVAQKEVLRAAGMYQGLFGRKSNPGRRRMTTRVALVQARLQTLAQRTERMAA